MKLPALSLYVHIPWCVQKCPYCDFNSHSQKGIIPETDYIQDLLNDLKQDLHYVQGRLLKSIFIGGGTPSLLTEAAIGKLIKGIQAMIPFEENIEITLEANPGTVESGRFKGYVDIGINRISIGIQSMQNEKLKALGRIHDADEAIKAAEQARNAGLNSFNLDLMHGLPGQSLEDALGDLHKVIALKPKHISWYQLTIEENTQFHSRPPKLPEDEALWDIQEQGHQILTDAGYQQYEISGYSLPDYQCQHNLNYWRFGDYLGIGCGAHGKISLPIQNKIVRTVKIKHPKGYMAPSESEQPKSYLFNCWQVEQDDLPFEFFMNRLRLFEAFDQSEFTDYTGLPINLVAQSFIKASEQGLILQSVSKNNAQQWQVTAKGHRYLNDLLELFV